MKNSRTPTFGPAIICNWPVFLVITVLALLACNPAKRSGRSTTNRPDKPARTGIPNRNTPIDTIRWSRNEDKAPIKNETGNTGVRPNEKSDTYHIAFLLPFLSNQGKGGIVPERSELALQFYNGAKIALEQASVEENLNLVVDTWDTQANDADFQSLLNTNSRVQKPVVFIGPVRSSHLEIFSEWAKARRKIVVSPDSPSSELANQNPDFIQMNPSLRAHCTAITQYVRKASRTEAVTLVCKEKEASRLQYFQEANAGLSGGGLFNELLVPDGAANFDKIDLRPYLKSGRTNVFILPSWSSQDYVMAFLRRLKAQKGSYQVAVFGMPQWRGFEVIDAGYLKEMNVHISAASYIDYKAEEIEAFQQKFYEVTGTIPNADAFNGYDVTLFTIRMLAQYGLSFPSRLEKVNYTGLHGTFRFSKIYNNSGLDAGSNKPDYLENTSLHILKFGDFGYEPVEQR